MNLTFINKIAPGHDRVDCADDNLKNHTRTPYDQGCRRCDLLKAAGEDPEDHNLKLKAEFPDPPAPPKERIICDMCGDITEAGKHTNWLCIAFKWWK
jgi:hypothetical protein